MTLTPTSHPLSSAAFFIVIRLQCGQPAMRRHWGKCINRNFPPRPPFVTPRPPELPACLPACCWPHTGNKYQKQLNNSKRKPLLFQRYYIFFFLFTFDSRFWRNCEPADHSVGFQCGTHKGEKIISSAIPSENKHVDGISKHFLQNHILRQEFVKSIH